jgi:radical SAM superfamily enzyme YgiQ (UPF0313 family)
MFLPTTREEMQKLGWKQCDVILVTGDAYIDSSYIGIAVIGKYLLKHGFKTGVIAQPDYKSPVDITRLGEPAVYWGISSGCVDSMVSNFTAALKRRRQDDFTPGGFNDKRPDNAVVVYSNLIRQYFKNTKPILLGGIEASLRRITHYDYLKDNLKKSILFDSKADYVIYGMGEKASVELAEALRDSGDPKDIKGLCYISKEKKHGYIEVPSHDECKADKAAFSDMFMKFYKNETSSHPAGLIQQQDTRYLIQNPPQVYTGADMDEIYGLGYERDAHPYYKKMGSVRALETIRFSITTHRGCFGNCNFCAIASTQGRKILERSEASILKEAAEIAALPDFGGYITDLGGPTANMYGMSSGAGISHKRQIELLKKVRQIEGVKKVFIASGIRYDLIFKDREYGVEYMEEVVGNHVSGQLKIAPEHTEDKVLKNMGKPGTRDLLDFKKEYDRINNEKGLHQHLSYYFIAAHPGCDELDMKKAVSFIRKELGSQPEQAQIFTPTPSTISTLMYYTGVNPLTGEKVFVEKNIGAKEHQKRILTGEKPPQR